MYKKGKKLSGLQNNMKAVTKELLQFCSVKNYTMYTQMATKTAF